MLSVRTSRARPPARSSRRPILARQSACGPVARIIGAAIELGVSTWVKSGWLNSLETAASAPPGEQTEPQDADARARKSTVRSPHQTLAESARILQYAPDEQTRDCVVTGIEKNPETDLPVELSNFSAKRSTKRLSSRPRNKPQAISPDDRQGNAGR